MTAFSEFNLHERLLKAVDKMGFSEATPVQTAVIPQVASGRDIVVSAKTGSGKTGAFILPMLISFLAQEKPRSATRGLILSPTRELALQTQKAFENFAGYTQIKSGLIIGGEPFKYQISTVRRNPEIIIATPGRLVEHIENNNMDFSELEFLVLDEADRMLDMGFAESLNTISEACNPARQNLLFSATFKHQGFSRVRAQLKDPLHIELDDTKDGHSQITHQRVLADDDTHKEKLIVGLIEEEKAERVFVFCNTRLQAQKLSNMLRAAKLRSAYIHGDIAQSDRKQILNRFRDGSVQVLVATDVAARGLDIKEVDLVINYSVPHSGDDHTHRAGRTGRAEKEGKAITLVTSTEWDRASSIERYLKIRFEARKVKGLEGNYRGPKKLKSSGKAAGPKKKKTTNTKGSSKPKPKVKKAKHQGRAVNTAADAVSVAVHGDGSAPLRRKKSE